MPVVAEQQLAVIADLVFIGAGIKILKEDAVIIMQLRINIVVVDFEKRR